MSNYFESTENDGTLMSQATATPSGEIQETPEDATHLTVENLRLFEKIMELNQADPVVLRAAPKAPVEPPPKSTSGLYQCSVTALSRSTFPPELTVPAFTTQPRSKVILPPLPPVMVRLTWPIVKLI